MKIAKFAEFANLAISIFKKYAIMPAPCRRIPSDKP